MLCRMGLGHTGMGLNSSLKLIGYHGTGLCNGCMVEETVEHVLLFCEMYDAEMERLFDRVREVRGEWGLGGILGIVRFVGNFCILFEITGSY